MADKGFNFFGAHIFGVAFVVEEDISSGSGEVGLFSADGIVLDSDGTSNPIHQLPRYFCHRVGPGMKWCTRPDCIRLETVRGSVQL